MSEFRMPSLGADMEAGTLAEWVKHPGDPVTRGDIIAVVDTQKGAIEVEVFEDGILDRIVVPEGETVPVGTVLAVIRGAAEPAPASVAPAPAAAAARHAAPGAPPHHIRASPLARKVAAERGIDLAHVTGSGPSGAILREDVARAMPAAGVQPAPARATGMRAAIAAAMARSKREIPHYYLSTTIDLGASQAWLKGENAKRPVPDRLLMIALLLKAVARALGEVPELNGHWVDGGFRPGSGIHVGCAIALRGGGLVAPAIHDADRLDVGPLMRAVRDLVARARAGSLRSSELSDPTITVTSLGDQGVDATFGVIYPPQVAIVGFGRVTERPWVVGGGLGVRPLVTATLAGDHRVSDGHRGGLFLAAVDRLLQAPEAL
jgi:pyruvate dehydrogenase E2 component (dihydrolipoyllysine-residue acetyltransferase)